MAASRRGRRRRTSASFPASAGATTWASARRSSESSTAQIGEIIAIQENYLRGALRPPPAEARVERNAISVPELVSLQLAFGRPHRPVADPQLDQASWVLGDVPPLQAWGMGGRQVCVEPKYGDVFDHHAMVFEYRQRRAACSAIAATFPAATTKLATSFSAPRAARFLPGRHRRSKAKNPWRYDGPKPNMYDVEHKELFEASAPASRSTTASTCAYAPCWEFWPNGRYTGQQITWDQAMKSELSFALPRYGWDVEPPVKPGANGQYPTAMPGLTQFR